MMLQLIGGEKTICQEFVDFHRNRTVSELKHALYAELDALLHCRQQNRNTKMVKCIDRANIILNRFSKKKNIHFLEAFKKDEQVVTIHEVLLSKEIPFEYLYKGKKLAEYPAKQKKITRQRELVA